MAKKVTHTLTRIVPGSKVVYVDENDNELFVVQSVSASGIVNYVYEYKKPDKVVQIYINHLYYKWRHLEDVVLGKKDQIFQVQQDFDPFYENPD